MALCSFSSLVRNSSCGSSPEYPDIVHCVTLENCKKDVSRNLEIYGISEDISLHSEMKLLLTRAGISSFDESHASITVCPKHRADYGIR
ncbi:hypothetical protein QZH41_014807 [Actinostola sp. cb2023]|nr:hypothetical protein QZH41_010984 [Actinostola sp. cb2023]KAK3726955.1 hypothetical protein QZH41_014807 [Actinostola sp. cb2023]